MELSKIGFVRIVGLSMIAAAIVSPAHAAGFSIFEQGSKAMGLATAFTAQADDPSAMFYNVGGLAFFDQREFYAGLTFISVGDATFEGADPTPGAGQPGNQAGQLPILPNFYWVEPVSDRWVVGLSVTSPFGFATEWNDPAGFEVVEVEDPGNPGELIEVEVPTPWSGRYISDKADLKDIDLTPNVGFRINDKLGVGFGIVARFSSVELSRRIDGNVIDSGIPAGTDVASTRVESDTDIGFGFNFGLLHRLNDFFSWGFSYRSKVTVDYSGDALLTQISTGVQAVDDAVAAALPFGQNLPLDTSIEFPDEASLGVAFRFNPRWLFEADFNWTGWSSFDQLSIDVNPPYEGLSETHPQLWEDAINVRTGVRWDRTAKSHWRFGIYWDESPQPEETVSPVLPDADRLGYAVGYGLTAEKFTFDIALLYVDFAKRTTTSNVDDFFGTYRSDTVNLGTSFAW
jgi:long-chain fatty acid transport protein